AFRVVTNRARETEIRERSRQAGADLSSSNVAPNGWRVTKAGPLLSELAAAGQIYLQDEASQLVATCLDVKPGQRILDLCAAPGSKTTHIGNLSQNAASIVAGDLHYHRLRTVV